MTTKKQDEVFVRPVVMLDVDLLDNADYNPQEQLKITFNELVKKIRRNGFCGTVKVAPNLKKKGRFLIVAGNHAVDAARLIELKKVPCNVFEDWDEDRQKAENVSDNIVRGKFNPEKLAKVYDDLAKKYGDELTQKMMSLEVDNTIVSQIMKQIRREIPPEMQKQLDGAKGEIKTVDQLSAILNEMFTKYGDDLQYGFMVFEFGGKSHYWIKMNNKLKKKMQGFTDECRETGGQLSERLYAAMGCDEET
jgi:ParB/RepB/Spo0J family partition protein